MCDTLIRVVPAALGTLLSSEQLWLQWEKASEQSCLALHSRK